MGFASGAIQNGDAQVHLLDGAASQRDTKYSDADCKQSTPNV